MGIKKITKQIEKFAIESHDDGYDAGWHDGYNSAVDDVATESFSEGVEAERERIEAVIKMQIEWATQEGKGSQIVFWNKVNDILIGIPRHFQAHPIDPNAPIPGMEDF